MSIETEDEKDAFASLLMETLGSMFPEGTKYFLIVGPESEHPIDDYIGIGNFSKEETIRLLKEAVVKVELGCTIRNMDSGQQH